MTVENIDPSEVFGQTDGLLVYKSARSLDRGSERPDQPIEILAESAVRTAIRFMSEEYPAEALSIDIMLATQGLMKALEAELPG